MERETGVGERNRDWRKREPQRGRRDRGETKIERET